MSLELYAKDNKIVNGSAVGDFISLSESGNEKIQSLRIFGKTTQDGTPTPDAPVPLVSAGDEGSIAVNVAGKNLLDFDGCLKAWGATYTKDGERYTITNLGNGYVQPITLFEERTKVAIQGVFKNITSVNGRIEFGYFKDGVFTVSTAIKEDVNKANDIQITAFRLNHSSGGTYTVGNIQLELSTTVTDFEPYKEQQTITISTPNGLPGIPVESGGNYTDENGQQWVCDEINFARGVHIQRIGKIESYNSESVGTVYLSSTGELSAGAEVIYPLANPIETALSAEELAAYAALHTYSPNTTIYNDAGAVMEVKYAEKSYTNRYEISHAISVQMSEYYNDVGKLILVMPVNDYNIEALKNDSILYDTQKKVSYILKNVKTDTPQNRITANGYTTNHRLNSRVIASPVAVTNVESGVYTIVNDNLREMTKVSTAAVKGLTEETEITLYGKPVLEQIMPVLASAELGHKMMWNHRTEEHVFEVYKGNDLTSGIHAVVFSDEQGTARDLVINDDVSTFKNVAYVVAKFNDKQLVEVVGDATGDDRHEQWFEISLSPEENETETKFRSRMRVHGAMELGKLIKRQSFSVVIDPAELGTVYNIGDLVSCVSQRFGVKFNARISGMKYKKDAGSETTEVVLGEPKLTAIGEVKLSG